MTDQTAKIAALQTLNARLLQDNLRLARDNEELRARLSAESIPAVTARPRDLPASTRDARSGDVRPDLAAIAQETANRQPARRETLRPSSRSPGVPEGRGVVHVPAGVPLFDRPPAERRFLVGEARTREAGTRTDLPGQTPLRRILAGSTPVRRTSLSTPNPTNPPRDQATYPRAQERTQVQSPDDPRTQPRPRPRAQDQDDARRTTDSTHEDDASARFSLLELD